MANPIVCAEALVILVLRLLFWFNIGKQYRDFFYPHQFRDAVCAQVDWFCHSVSPDSRALQNEDDNLFNIDAQCKSRRAVLQDFT